MTYVLEGVEDGLQMQIGDVMGSVATWKFGVSSQVVVVSAETGISQVCFQAQTLTDDGLSSATVCPLPLITEEASKLKFRLSLVCG